MGMARTRRVSTFVVAFNDSRIVDGPGFTSIYRWIYSWWPNSNFFSDRFVESVRANSEISFLEFTSSVNLIDDSLLNFHRDLCDECGCYIFSLFHRSKFGFYLSRRNR